MFAEMLRLVALSSEADNMASPVFPQHSAAQSESARRARVMLRSGEIEIFRNVVCFEAVGYIDKQVSKPS